jgi:hypothetical protein
VNKATKENQEIRSMIENQWKRQSPLGKHAQFSGLVHFRPELVHFQPEVHDFQLEVCYSGWKYMYSNVEYAYSNRE